MENQLFALTAQMNTLELTITPLTRMYNSMGESAAAKHPFYPDYIALLAKWDGMKAERDQIKTAIFDAKKAANA